MPPARRSATPPPAPSHATTCAQPRPSRRSQPLRSAPLGPSRRWPPLRSAPPLPLLCSLPPHPSRCFTRIVEGGGMKTRCGACYSLSLPKALPSPSHRGSRAASGGRRRAHSGLTSRHRPSPRFPPVRPCTKARRWGREERKGIRVIAE